MFCMDMHSKILNRKSLVSAEDCVNFAEEMPAYKFIDFVIDNKSKTIRKKTEMVLIFLLLVRIKVQVLFWLNKECLSIFPKGYLALWSLKDICSQLNYYGNIFKSKLWNLGNLIFSKWGFSCLEPALQLIDEVVQTMSQCFVMNHMYHTSWRISRSSM